MRSGKDPRATVAIQWPSFGPYHIARLDALAGRADEQDIDVVGIETASQDDVYGFSRETDVSARIETLCPGAVFDQLSPRKIAREMIRCLDGISPLAVFITSYSYPDARAALRWCKDNGRLAILMTDSKADAGRRAYWREWIKRRIVAGFDAALVAGSLHRDYLEALGFQPEAIFEGYNTVDNQYFASGADDAISNTGAHEELPGLNSKEPFFLACGRMTPTKNYWGLLESYRRYRELAEFPWRLVIIGDGPLRTELETVVRHKGIVGVTFAGRRSYAELPAYYGLASAFVHFAFVDTWGLVVNEAMACGLPILCSTGAGCWKDLVVDGKNGFVFGPDDTSLAATLMHRLSRDGPLRERMGSASKVLIQSWGLPRFADGALSSYEWAATKGPSEASAILRGILKLLDWTVRKPTSFHSIKP